MSISSLNTEEIISTYLKPAVRMVSVLSVIAVMVLSVRYCSVSEALDIAYDKQDEQYQEILRLNTALALQNESIEQLNLQTGMAQRQAEAAMEVAQANNRSLARAIDDINAIEVTECEATAPVVARAIEALKMGQSGIFIEK